MHLKYMALIVRVWVRSVRIRKICVFQNFCRFYFMKIGCGEGVSINDLGCGYGALYEFIKMNNICLSKYFGYDISEEMIEAANEFILNNNQEKDCEIFLENSSLITHYADYSITSGIFNMIFCLFNIHGNPPSMPKSAN